MAAKYPQWLQLHFNSGNTQIDEEQQRRKKRKKCILYIVLLGIIKAGITLLFLLTVLKFRTPKFRIRAATFETLDYSAAAVNPSFSARMHADLTLKNTNFIKYKFQSSNISFYHNGEAVGSVFVTGSRVRARSTEEWEVTVDLIGRAQLGSDLRSGVLMLNGRSRLNGKVELLKVLKQKKSAEMDCIVAVDGTIVLYASPMHLNSMLVLANFIAKTPSTNPRQHHQHRSQNLVYC